MYTDCTKLFCGSRELGYTMRRLDFYRSSNGSYQVIKFIVFAN